MIRHRGHIERALDDIASGRARILLGTQMLAKGHDYPDVTLVAVLNADQGLFGADFRASERLAQQIVQVSGRAGRGDRAGEVLIQTAFPEHPLLASHIAGGSLTGRRIVADAPITKGLNCLLVATAADLGSRGPEMPCIRCGDCATVWPAGLLPQQLHVAARAGDSTGLVRLGLDACIECGCCDYVCPSAIPLTARFRATRERLCLEDLERRRALDAKARFEGEISRTAMVPPDGITW